jgi:murein DD-endopeptidase MepM/ murein hydrolase activator NlpD
MMGVFFLAVVAAIMLLDYAYVMRRIDENNDLKLENRRLRQQVQIFQNRMSAIESTMERVQTFTNRLKVITNIEDKGTLLQTFNQELPDASTNIGTQMASDEKDPESVRLKRDAVELDQRFWAVGSEALKVEQQLQDLYELLFDQRVFLAALPTRRPSFGYFTSGFGIRRSPYGGVEKMHEGLDIANHYGTPILSTANGVVTFAGPKPGYGRTVIIDHGYGLETWYGHSSKLLVRDGEKVRRGQRIALMGSTGRSTGPHVHYEVRVNGTPVDPLSYLLED